MRPILSRWEVDPPAIHGAEAYGRLRETFAVLRSLGAVRPLTPAVACDCGDCSRRCRVEYVADRQGVQRAFIHCPDCGVAPASERSLERWAIDAERFLAATFHGIRLSIQSRVPDRLWQVGRANWSGRLREVWFARGRPEAAAVQELARRPKAILFVPTEFGAGRWQDAVECVTIALEAAVAIDAGAIVLDGEYVESRIADAAPSSDAAIVRRPKKRASRAAAIESLVNELVAHLQAARDLAFSTQDRTGEPNLLPRPSQKELAERTGLSRSDVTRCLQDEAARELRLYWEMAQELGQVLNWKGPIRKGARS